MILASGNVAHNLRRIQWNEPSGSHDWAERFDDAVVEQLSRDPGDILKVQELRDYALAVPTPDHFAPLLDIGAWLQRRASVQSLSCAAIRWARHR